MIFAAWQHLRILLVVSARLLPGSAPSMTSFGCSFVRGLQAMSAGEPMLQMTLYE
jgi:hypothetical protein